jgi:flagellar biosynthesis protein FlhG|uniref:MinD/ParA family protein n=1 Tax=Desulfobacca acetoxidans TaxID=60893 RepID=A0A7V6A0U6_9BACT
MKLWSVGGGKGGVGKSIFTMALGVTLARLGNQVILVDGDLGGANLHTMMGIRFPEATLEDFLLRKVTRLEEILLPTSLEGIKLICGADDLLGAANPTYSQKMRLFKELERLPADFVLIDLGAGTSFNTLDFFNNSPGKIAVFSGVATSLQNVYGFIKCALFRKIAREFGKEDQVLSLLYDEDKTVNDEIVSINDLLAKVRQISPEQLFQLAGIIKPYRLFLVTNMVKNEQDLRSPEIIQSVCEDFLSIKPEILGHIFYDPVVEVAINRMSPRLLQERTNRMVKCYEQIARKMMKFKTQSEQPPASEGKNPKKGLALSKSSRVM